MSSELLEEQNLKIMLSLFCEEKYDMLASAAEQMSAQAKTELECRLAALFLSWAANDNQQAVDHLYALSQDQSVFEDNDCRLLLLPFWIRSQLLIPQRSNPAHKEMFKVYRSNLRALKKLDPDMADIIDSNNLPINIIIVSTWSGLTGYDLHGKLLLEFSESELSQLDVLCDKIQSIGFAGVQRAKHIIYCLNRQYEGLYGMTRLHYVFEENYANLKFMFSLYDFSKYLQTNELKVFGGDNWHEHLHGFVRDGYYLLPNTIVADSENIYDPKVKELQENLSQGLFSTQESVSAYYNSEEFKDRQCKIAKGELMPRVLVATCRWTTFLRYAARDFQLAFEDIGCQTRYMIEGDDVQSLTLIANYNLLEDFKPDVFFAVSHARPSYSFLPKKLPVISNIQDKCGKLSEIMDISDYYSKNDLYVCISPAHADYVSQRNVPTDQIMIWPMPAPGRLFYQLDSDVKVPSRYTSDVSFVKHCNGWHEDVMKRFFDRVLNSPSLKEADAKKICNFFAQIHNEYSQKDTARIYEDEIIEFTAQAFGVDMENDEKKMHFIKYLCHNYYVEPFSDMWRGQFIEALAEAGFDIALYGNGWDKYPALAKYARGTAKRDTELNYVYNNSKVNLLISQAATMHVRIAECGLSNAFIMISDHPQDKDWGPARDYYEEGSEVIFFNDRKDLIDKTRYYLDHEDERMAIAAKLREKVIATMSCKSVAEKIIDKWRTLLTGGQNDNS